MEEKFDLKCSFCSAVNPKIHNRVVAWSNGVIAALFACGKCKRIIAISALPETPKVVMQAPAEVREEVPVG